VVVEPEGRRVIFGGAAAGASSDDDAASPSARVRQTPAALAQPAGCVVPLALLLLAVLGACALA
jgi:hypothetical protein